MVGDKGGKEDLILFLIFQKVQVQSNKTLTNLKLEKIKVWVILLWRGFEETGKNYSYKKEPRWSLSMWKDAQLQ